MYWSISKHTNLMKKILLTILIFVFYFSSNAQSPLRINKYLIDSLVSGTWFVYHDSTHTGQWGVLGGGGGGSNTDSLFGLQDNAMNSFRSVNMRGNTFQYDSVGAAYWFGEHNYNYMTFEGDDGSPAFSLFTRNAANTQQATLDLYPAYVSWTAGGNYYMQIDALASQIITRAGNTRLEWYDDSLKIVQSTGRINIPTLRDGATYNINKLMGWGSGNGVVGYVTIGSNLSLSAGVLSATGGGSGIDSTYADSTFIKTAAYTADQKRGNYLGTLYEKTGFSTLDTFALSGTTTPTISNSKILLGGGATDGAVTLKRYTMLNRATLKAGFKVGAKNGATLSFNMGFASANTTYVQNIVGVFHHRSTPSQYDGFLTLQDGEFYANVLNTSATAVSFSAGDSIEVTLQRDVNIFTFTARNVTTDGAPVSISYTYTGLTTAVNTSRPFMSATGSDSVYYFHFYSNESTGADLITIGDSKFTWYGNTINEAIPSQMYALNGNTIGHYGSGDKTLEVTLTTSEIIALTPRQALINIGSNDIRNGISSGTWQANIDTIYNRLTAAGITVYFALAYETAISQTALVSYLNSTYPTRYISEGYDTTFNCTSCLISDGIHLTSYGDSIWVEAIGQSGMINFAGSSGSQTFSNTSDATSHTVTLSNSGGSFQLVEGSNITLTTTGTSSNGIITIASSGGSSTWNGISDPTGDQALTFQAGESSTWTDQNTTEDLFTVNNATSTTNSLFSLNRTSTAIAGGNNIMELISSGTNTTGGITATGLSISVTNTHGSLGTNKALVLAASGAPEYNLALEVTAGRVGLGDGTPQTLLQVGSDGGTSSAFGTAAQLLVSNSGSGAFISVLGPSSAETFIGTGSGTGIIGTISNDPLAIRTNNNDRIGISNGGVVTIGNLAGTGSRAVLADASGVLSAPVSDISVKKNIQSLDYGLNTIMQLNPVSFEYKDGWKNYGSGMQVGFIAQDIQKLLPNSTFVTPTTGKMGYNEIDLIPVLTKAIQEQQEQIEKLEREVKKLKRK